MQQDIIAMPTSRAELNQLLAQGKQERAKAASSFFTAIFRNKTVKNIDNHDYADCAAASA